MSRCNVGAKTDMSVNKPRTSVRSASKWFKSMRPGFVTSIAVAEANDPDVVPHYTQFDCWHCGKPLTEIAAMFKTCVNCGRRQS